MIIKKKYLQKPHTEEQKEPEIQTDSEVEEVVENELQEEEPVQEEIQEESDIDELDLAIDNIKFEQREERREGTRRRGYRRTQDRNLISRAQQEALSIKEAAKQEGYEQGIIEAKQDLDNIKSKFSEFYSYKDELFEKVSECIYDISIEIAKKIIKEESQTKKELIIPIIKEAVSEINRTENKIVLHVMPQDVELVKDKIPEIFSENNTEANITVVPDKEIKEGGVIVETSNGLVDATIETQLTIIEKALNKTKGE